MRLPRKYKKECKKCFLSFPVLNRWTRQEFRDLYKRWIVEMPFFLKSDQKTWDLFRYVDDGCNSRRNCRNNLNPRVGVPAYTELTLDELAIMARLENSLYKFSKCSFL